MYINLLLQFMTIVLYSHGSNEIYLTSLQSPCAENTSIDNFSITSGITTAIRGQSPSGGGKLNSYNI